MARSTRRTKARSVSSNRSLSPDARAAYTQVAGGLRALGTSIAEIQRSLRQAERRIETDARVRIRALRREASAQLRALESRRREVTRILRNLAAAAEGSWGEIKHSADVILAEARTTTAAVVERVRDALRS
jgi:hypothetical protein